MVTLYILQQFSYPLDKMKTKQSWAGPWWITRTQLGTQSEGCQSNILISTLLLVCGGFTGQVVISANMCVLFDNMNKGTHWEVSTWNWDTCPQRYTLTTVLRISAKTLPKLVVLPPAKFWQKTIVWKVSLKHWKSISM